MVERRPSEVNSSRRVSHRRNLDHARIPSAEEVRQFGTPKRQIQPSGGAFNPQAAQGGVTHQKVIVKYLSNFVTVLLNPVERRDYSQMQSASFEAFRFQPISLGKDPASATSDLNVNDKSSGCRL